MNAQKNILFTFDYELFLGAKSGSVQNCLLKPTALLLHLFEKYKFNKLIFFVDTTYLLKLKQLKNNKAINDYKLIIEQLKKINSHGHYIFPHIHPHWLDAIYNERTNDWNLSNASKYRFHNIDKDEREILFNDSIILLKDVIGTDRSIDGYRAGGWCIQPFTDFKPYFEKHSIKYEFSVLPQQVNTNNIQYYNFENVTHNSIYKFNNAVDVVDNLGSYTEYSISNVEIPLLNNFCNRLFLKYLWKTGNRNFGDGNGAIISDNKNIVDLSKEMISIELLTKVRLPIYKNFINKFDYMQFISHPKMISKHNLKCLELFLDFVLNNYPINSDFRTIQTN